MSEPRASLRVVGGASAPRRHLPVLGPARDADRSARPIYAVWEVTLRCDLACDHCGSRAGRARADELDTPAALGLVRALGELGVKEVTLIGGEAYLRPDWLEIVAAIRDAGMVVSMTTGGRGLTAERAAAAASAGLQGIGFSIDGLEEAHDTLRGAGSFAAMARGMTHARDAGIPVSANTQINRANRDDLERIYEWIRERGAYGWQVALTVPMGRAADRPDLVLQPFDLDDVYPRLAALARDAATKGFILSRGNNVGYFGPHESDFAIGEPVDYTCGCSAGKDVLGIEADGTIKGCPSLLTDHHAAGSVQDHPLADLWLRSPRLQALRDHDPAALWGFCATCYYRAECRAGCTWMADAVLGRPGNNPYCHHRVLELKSRGLRERVVRTAEAPGLPFDRAEHEIVLEPWA